MTRQLAADTDTKAPGWLNDLLVDFEHHAMHVQRVASESRWSEYAIARRNLTQAKRRLIEAVATHAEEAGE